MQKPFTGSIKDFLRDKDGKLSSKAIVFFGALAVLITVFIAVVVIRPKQIQRQKALEAERAKKQEELDALELEREYMQEIASQTESREYLIRYLRETKGYILDGDIRIDLADPYAPIPTPVTPEDEG